MDCEQAFLERDDSTRGFGTIDFDIFPAIFWLSLRRQKLAYVCGAEVRIEA